MNLLLLQLRNYTKFSRKTLSALVFISIKHVFLTFSLRARLIRTPGNMDTMARPLGVRINRVPLYYQK